MTLNKKTSSSKKPTLPQISTESAVSFFRDVIREKELIFKKLDQVFGRKPFNNKEFTILYNERLIDLQVQIKDALLVFGASRQLATSLSLRFLGFHQERLIYPFLQQQTANPEKADQGGGNT